MKKSIATERAIKSEFSGKSNKGIRNILRNCESAEEVRGKESQIALTASGKASLESVAKTFEK